MRKIYVVVVELCMIVILLSTLKGSNSYKNVEKNIILESSWKCASGLLHISLCTNKLTTVPITVLLLSTQIIDFFTIYERKKK